MARPKGGARWLRESTRLALYRRDEFCCVYCGKSMFTDKVVLTVDHVLPVAHTGRPENRPWNLATCCWKCNGLKGDTRLEDFVGRQRAVEVRAQVRKPLDRAWARATVKEQPEWWVKAKRRASGCWSNQVWFPFMTGRGGRFDNEDIIYAPGEPQDDTWVEDLPW